MNDGEPPPAARSDACLSATTVSFKLPADMVGEAFALLGQLVHPKAKLLLRADKSAIVEYGLAFPEIVELLLGVKLVEFSFHIRPVVSQRLIRWTPQLIE